MKTEALRKQLIFLTTEGSTVLTGVLKDLLEDKRAKTFEIFPEINNPILKVMRKIHCSSKVNSLLPLPFKEIWHNALDDIKWERDVEYHIVFISHSFIKLPMSFWTKLKQVYNVKYSLLMLNAMESYVSRTLKLKEAIQTFENQIGFEFILTVHPADAKKYGYVFFNNVYSMIEGSADHEIKYDLYLVNRAKGRLDTFHKVYEQMKKHNVKVKFRIVEVAKKNQIYRDEILYNQCTKYDQTINEIKESNCLLEVLGSGQTSVSNHYFEAVCYNKKLLTDNKNVIHQPFYNPEYIHIFEKPEDIDCDWVKERIPVDYHYDGSFSPARLIDKINELEKEKEGKPSGPEQAS